MRFDILVERYGKLWKLGNDIIKYRSKMQNQRYFAIQVSNEYTTQLSKIKEFDKLAQQLSKDQKLYKKSYYEYWSGY